MCNLSRKYLSLSPPYEAPVSLMKSNTACLSTSLLTTVLIFVFVSVTVFLTDDVYFEIYSWLMILNLVHISPIPVVVFEILIGNILIISL